MNSKALSKQIGENIRSRRLAAELTQAQLCERAGVSVKHVSRLELGEETNASVITLQRLSEALGCEVSELVAQTSGGIPPGDKKILVTPQRLLRLTRSLDSESLAVVVRLIELLKQRKPSTR